MISVLADAASDVIGIINGVTPPWQYAILGAAALIALYLEYRVTFLLRLIGHRPLPGTLLAGQGLRLLFVFSLTAFVWWSAMWLGLDEVLPYPQGVLEKIALWFQSIDLNSILS